MTSKKLGALLRSVPPATAEAEALPPTVMQEHAAAPQPVPNPPAPTPATGRGKATPIEPEVPLQVLVPASIRRQLAIKAAEQGESLRSLVLQAIRGLGVEVTDADIRGKRKRRNS